MRRSVGSLNIGDKFIVGYMFNPTTTPLHTVKSFRGDFVLCERYDGTPEAFRKNDEVLLIFPNKNGDA